MAAHLRRFHSEASAQRAVSSKGRAALREALAAPGEDDVEAVGAVDAVVPVGGQVEHVALLEVDQHRLRLATLASRELGRM